MVLADLEPRDRLAQALWDAKRAQHPEEFMPTMMTDLGSCLRVADELIGRGVTVPDDLPDACQWRPDCTIRHEEEDHANAV